MRRPRNALQIELPCAFPQSSRTSSSYPLSALADIPEGNAPSTTFRSAPFSRRIAPPFGALLMQPRFALTLDSAVPLIFPHLLRAEASICRAKNIRRPPKARQIELPCSVGCFLQKTSERDVPCRALGGRLASEVSISERDLRDRCALECILWPIAFGGLLQEATDGARKFNLQGISRTWYLFCPAD